MSDINVEKLRVGPDLAQQVIDQQKQHRKPKRGAWRRSYTLLPRVWELKLLETNRRRHLALGARASLPALARQGTAGRRHWQDGDGPRPLGAVEIAGSRRARRVHRRAGSSLTLSSNATFDNKPGGTFAFITDGPITAGTGGGSFINEGAPSKTGGTGTSTVGVTLNTTGAIQSNSGILSLRGGGTISGSSTLTTAAGGTLDFNAGTFAAAAGSSITGTGTVSFSGATVTVDGTYSVAGTTLVSGGEVDFTTAASTAALTETGGTIGGSATLTISGLTTWTNGTMSGTGVTNANGGLMLGGSVASAYTETLSGRTLNNAGAATVSYFAPQGGSSLTLSSGATFDNKAGATFAFITDGPITAGTEAAASSTKGR